VSRLGAAVLDLSALAALVGVVPLAPPEVDTPIAADAALVDLADLLRVFHDQRPADVHGDLVLVGAAVSEWVPASRYLATLTDLACRRSDLPIGDVSALALARTAHLPLVTGLADLAGVDPEVAVMVLPRHPQP
jgi:hypothetical protein